jgi:hypothetical protein
LAVEPLARQANRGFRSFNTVHAEAFARHEPEIGAGTRTHLQQAYPRAVGRLREVVFDKADHIFARILAPGT